MNRRWLKVAVSLFGLLAVMASAGCFKGSGREFVPIDYENYRPYVGETLKAYRGRSVYLMDVVNRAEDTSLSTYYSPNEKYVYGDPNSGVAGIGGRPLGSYFWYSFQKALLAAGVRVSSLERPDPKAPAVEFTMTSINDARFQWRVQIYDRTNPVFSKNYTITERALGTDELTPVNLEKRAYRMVNTTLVMVFGDPEFKRAFNRASH